MLKLIIVPSEATTRLVARDATGVTRLRATLPTRPWRAKALPQLLDAIGSFLPLRAALAVASSRASYATTLYPDWFTDFGGSGYELRIIGSTRRDREAWWR